MMLASGTRLGVYEIVVPIGSGGFGEVYRARDTRLDRSVAIKVLPSADPELKTRFDREARTIASLQHPHVCALHDIGHDRGLDYLVLELLEGETLGARIGRGPLPLTEALTIGRAIASALDRAHSAGIVHRDLKPDNVMLTRAGPKLLDFGLAKLRRPGGVLVGGSAVVTAEVPRLTAEGTIVGTLHYMSPEQIDGRDADARSDIWAFGCVLYEMLTGQKAFDGTTPGSLIAAIMSGSSPRVSPRRPLTPPSIDRVVAACLAPNPEDRFHSAHDLGLALQWIATGPAEDSHPPSTTRLRYVPWMVAAASVLGAILFSLLSLAPEQNTETTPSSSFLISTGPDNAPFPIAPMFLTVSPDGATVAFVAGEVGMPQRLAIRALNSTTTRWLPGTDHADQLFWSPDSRSIAFVDPLEVKLKRIEISGGPPRPIADIPGGRTLQGGTWNQNGDLLVGIIGGGNPLYKVPASGGTPVSVTTLDRAAGELAHFWPHFLPDGDHFLYTVPNATPARSGIFMSSLTSGGSTRIVDALSNAVYSAGFLLFVRDETLMAQRFDIERKTLVGEPVVVTDGMGTGAGNGRAAFAASRNGVLASRQQSGGVYTSALEWMDRAGNVLARVGTPNLYREIALSPNGRGVAAQIGWTVGSDIWVADVDRGLFTPVTSDPSNEDSPVWSPDGSRIAFASNRADAVFNVYEMPVDGSALPRRMFPSDRSERPVQWTAGWMLVESSGIRARRIGGDSAPLVIGSVAHPAEFAQLSPGEDWIAYAADDTGQIEVWLERFPAASDRVRVSANGGTRPHWRGDGRELYYLGLDNKVYAVPVTLGASAAFHAAQPLFPVRLLTATLGSTRFDGIQVDALGQRFLVNLASEGLSPLQPITVRVNWPEMLKPEP